MSSAPGRWSLRAALSLGTLSLAALSLAALSALACGGGPYRLSVASTPDRRHRVEIVEQEGRAALVSDGRRGPEFEAIASTSLTFDAAGEHVAYAVRDGAGYRLVLDHCTGPRFDGLGDIVFSPTGDRLAYAATRGDRWQVVVDGQPGPLVSSVLSDTLGFSRDGLHVVYAAGVEGRVRVYLDHAPGPLVDGVAQLSLAPDGSVAYVARRGASRFVVHDGVLGPPEVRIGPLWAGAGALAHAAWRGAGWVLLWNGRVASLTRGLPELVGSDDGRHVAWLAEAADGVRVWLDGVPWAGPYSRVRAGSLVFAHAAPAPSFVVESDGRACAVIAGVEQPLLDHVGALVFSADGQHSVYAGERGGGHLLVVDGRERPLPGPIVGLASSPDGSRLGFVPGTGPARVEVDGREHRFGFVLADTLAFAADGRHWAVLAGDVAERSLYFAIDGERGPPLDFSELISALARDEARGHRRSQNDLLRQWSSVVAAAATSPMPHAASAAPGPRWLSGTCASPAMDMEARRQP